MAATCTIAGCERPPAARGLCRMHYQRWHKHGDPTVTRAAANGSNVGCAVESCGRKHYGRGYCEMHYVRAKKHGDPEVVQYATGPRPQIRGAANASWIGDDCGYDGAHDRLKVRRGLATGHQCARCGGDAKEWAYDHKDPNERIDAHRGFPYSLNPDHYMPLCVPCHRRLDYEIIRLVA